MSPSRKDGEGDGAGRRKAPNESNSNAWKQIPFNQMGELNRGKSKHRPRNDAQLYGGPYPFIQTGDIRNSTGIITSHSQTYSDFGLKQSRLWPAGTLVITIAANIAESAVLTYPACFPDSVVGFIADESVCRKEFVPYLLRQAKANLQYAHVGTGSVQDNINLEILGKLEFLLPPISVQKAIANILGTLDDKIELNRRINQTLEEMAQALFKSWFVDFDPVRAKAAVYAAAADSANSEPTDPAMTTDPTVGIGHARSLRRQNGQWQDCEQQAELAAMRVISGKTDDELDVMRESQPEAYNDLARTASLFPSRLVESELGLIPEGWEIKSVGDVCLTSDFVANGSFESLKNNVKLYDEPNEVLYVRTTDYNSGFSTNLKYTDATSYSFLSKSSLFGRETLISNVGDVGTVFRPPAWLGLPMTLASNAVMLKSDESNGYIFWLFKSHYGQNCLQSIVTGSAQLKFNKTNLRSLRVIWPSARLLEHFESFELNLHNQHNSMHDGICRLTALRDSLLPKLLSGELEIPDELLAGVPA